MAGAKGDIGDPPAGLFCLVAQMIVKGGHIGFGVQPFADAALVGDDETGDAVSVEQRKRRRRAASQRPG